MKQSGQSIFEVVLAVGIVTVVLISIVGLVAVTQRNTNAAKTRAEASRSAQEALEWIRQERDTNWTAFYNRTAINTYCLDTLSWGNSNSCGNNELVTDKGFIREVVFTRDPNPNAVKTEVRVRWTDGQGTHDLRSTTQFTNWKGI